jgi:hypothetical protein
MRMAERIRAKRCMSLEAGRSGSIRSGCDGVLYMRSLSLLDSSLRNINVDNGFLSPPY